MPKLLKSLKNSNPRCGPKSEMLKLAKHRFFTLKKRLRNKPKWYTPINFKSK
jgi:hypothetical protein